MVVKIISSATEWRQALLEIGPHDFVHTYDFHVASERNGDGNPVLFVLGAEGNRANAIWPLLRRPIPGTKFFDYGSVYGYAGPIFRNIEVRVATDELLKAMASTGAVSVFSRMHPLFPALADTSHETVIGDVVVIDVLPEDQPPLGYRNNHRRNIARLVNDGFQTFVANDEVAFSRFQYIYERTMDSLHASASYYFHPDFYTPIRCAVDFESFIIFAEKAGESVAGVLFIITGDIMQYFLSATLPDYKDLAPSKLIIAQAHKIAVQRGIRRLILGGGVGGNRDTLFNFKLGFSKTLYPQRIFKRVFDRDRYLDLSAKTGADPDDISFFPAYRKNRA